MKFRKDHTDFFKLKDYILSKEINFFAQNELLNNKINLSKHTFDKIV